MDIAHVPVADAGRRLAFALILAFLAASCSKDPVSTDRNPLGQGRIGGQAFLIGDLLNEFSSRIRIEIFVAGTAEKVSTTFPNNDGRFLSDLLDGGNYDLTATVDVVPGYFPARVQNIVVVPGRTTEVPTIDVPDTSRVLFENLTPADGAMLSDRTPLVSGEFRSAGSGFKIETFALYINGQRVLSGLDVDVIQPLRFGRFSYTPALNLAPGPYQIQASMSNRAGRLSRQPWTFAVLEGIARRVPADYPTVAEAVLAANDGDTVLVSPGSHSVVNVWVNKDLAFISGGGPQETILRGIVGARIFEVGGDNRTVHFKGFTLTDGAPYGGEYAGAILCNDASLLIEDCFFTNNQTSGGGHAGAIAVYNSATVIRDCVFIANRAYRGGAIGIYDDSDPLIERCVFIRNANYDLGGAIIIEQTEVDIRNCTFYRNDAGSGVAGAIMVDGVTGNPGVLRSRDNLYIENLAGLEGGAIHFKDSSVSSICDGFYNNRGGNITGTGGSWHPVDMLELGPEVDPGFCDLAGEDLRLRPDSPFRAECERGALPTGCGP